MALKKYNNLQPATMARANLPFILTVSRSNCSLHCEPVRTYTKIDLVQGHPAQTLMNRSKMKLNVIIIVDVKSAGIYIMKQYIYSKVIFKIKGSENNSCI